MRTLLRPLIAAMASLTIFACASAPAPHDQDNDHAHGGAGGRLLVHTLDGTLRVYDADDGDLLAEFVHVVASGPAAVRTNSSGEFGFVITRSTGTVTIVDSGQVLEDHGDHADLLFKEPRLIGSVHSGENPQHFASGFGRSIIYNDGSGTVTVFADDQLRAGVAPSSLRARVDHGAPLMTGEALIVGYGGVPEIDVFSWEGARLQTLEGGTRLHGQARIGRFIAFGVREGVVLLTRRGEGRYERALVAYPPQTPEGGHTGTLRAHPLVPHFVGRVGESLLTVDPVGGAADLFPIGEEFRLFDFDRSGTHLVVLSRSGRLYDVDPQTMAIRGSIQAVPPSDEPLPALTLGNGLVWISDPINGRVVMIDLDHLETEREIAVETLAPIGEIVLMQPDGVVH